MSPERRLHNLKIALDSLSGPAQQRLQTAYNNVVRKLDQEIEALMLCDENVEIVAAFPPVQKRRKAK